MITARHVLDEIHRILLIPGFLRQAEAKAAHHSCATSSIRVPVYGLAESAPASIREFLLRRNRTSTLGRRPLVHRSLCRPPVLHQRLEQCRGIDDSALEQPDKYQR